MTDQEIIDWLKGQLASKIIWLETHAAKRGTLETAQKQRDKAALYVILERYQNGRS